MRLRYRSSSTVKNARECDVGMCILDTETTDWCWVIARFQSGVQVKYGCNVDAAKIRNSLPITELCLTAFDRPFCGLDYSIGILRHLVEDPDDSK